MTVLDASALLELVLHTPAGTAVAMRITDPALRLDVPHLVDVEVTQALKAVSSSARSSDRSRQDINPAARFRAPDGQYQR